MNKAWTHICQILAWAQTRFSAHLSYGKYSDSNDAQGMETDGCFQYGQQHYNK